MHMGLKLTVGKGVLAKKRLKRRLQGISQAINVNGKKDKYGLGFKPERAQKKKFEKRMRAAILGCWPTVRLEINSLLLIGGNFLLWRSQSGN